MLTIGMVSFSADALEAEITAARGGDAAGAVRKLENAVRRLKTMFQEAKGLAVGAEEAAAKCKVGCCCTSSM